MHIKYLKKENVHGCFNGDKEKTKIKVGAGEWGIQIFIPCK